MPSSFAAIATIAIAPASPRQTPIACTMPSAMISARSYSQLIWPGYRSDGDDRKGSCVTALCTLSISSLLNDSGCALSSSAIRSRFASDRARALMAGLGLLVAILIASKRLRPSSSCSGESGSNAIGLASRSPVIASLLSPVRSSRREDAPHLLGEKQLSPCLSALRRDHPAFARQGSATSHGRRCHSRPVVLVIPVVRGLERLHRLELRAAARRRSRVLSSWGVFGKGGPDGLSLRHVFAVRIPQLGAVIPCIFWTNVGLQSWPQEQRPPEGYRYVQA